jgi:hypothetical protein
MKLSNRRTTWRKLLSMVALACLTVPAYAHLGSPDTFVQAQAGPYTVLVGAHPPTVFPGPTEVDLRFIPADHVTSATASLDSGKPVTTKVFADGTAAASLWTATPDAHTLHVTAQGQRGAGQLDIPLPALKTPVVKGRAKSNAGPLIWAAAVLFYFACIAVLAGGKGRRRKIQLRIAVAFFVTSFALFAAAALVHPRLLAPETVLSTELADGGQLAVQLRNPKESFNDLVPDHGKPMHLFLVRIPQQDVFLHLHPVPDSAGNGFLTQLPAIPPGAYRLYADVVHLPPGQPLSAARSETVTARISLPAELGTRAGDPDDTSAVVPPINRPPAQVTVNGATQTQIAHLPDGYAMQLQTDASLKPLGAHTFRVTLEDPTGHPVADPAPYLGMSAHAVVLSRDGSVYAHIHAGSTLPMLISPVQAMDMPMSTASSTAEIPYGFPAPGPYRVFVQMKHGTTVETAAFDLSVK